MRSEGCDFRLVKTSDTVYACTVIFKTKIETTREN